MSNFLVIIISLFAGWWVGAPERARFFNQFVICISLPAMMFVQVPKLFREQALNGLLLLPALMPWLVLLISWILFGALGAWLRWDRKVTGALVLTAGLGNTSFVGFPLIEALMGPENLRYAVIVDQFGTFLALSTVGIAAAAFYSGTKISGRQIMRRILTFPPILSLLAAYLWVLSGEFARELLAPAAERLSLTLVPLAMFGIGLQLRPKRQHLRERAAPLTMGLSYKLAAAPACMALLAAIVTEPSALTRVTVLEAAMAPMVTAGVVAAENGLDGEFCALMIGLGLPLSLISVPLWFWAIA